MTEVAQTSERPTRFGIRNATHLYSGVPALQDVSFEMRSGSIHGLVGENGSGKSTLIRILTGAIAPTEGRLHIGDREVSFSMPLDARHAGIGVVHQDYNLFPDLSVAANIFGISQPPPRRRWSRTVNKQAVEASVDELLTMLGIEMSPRALLRNLGPAERKFVEIARAMMLRPSFLILDEPTASLEPRASASVLELLGNLRDQGVALCFVSHRLDEILKVTDVITVLRDGRRIDTVASEGITEEYLAELIVGTKQSSDGVETQRTVGDEVKLRVREMKLNGGPASADFEVRKGEIFGLTGLLGSGAAEIVRRVGGAESEGAVLEVDGKRHRIQDPQAAKRAGIGFIPEDRKGTGLVPDQSVAINVSLSSLRNVARRLGWLDRGAMHDRALSYREQLDIRTRSVDVPVRTLSGGNQQKVMLAKCLASGVEVLSIEEPTHGIDIGGKAQVHALLRAFADDGGAVLIASTDVHEVLAVCDRIGVMRHGALIGVLSQAELTTHELAAMGASDPEEFLEALVETGEAARGGDQPEQPEGSGSR